MRGVLTSFNQATTPLQVPPLDGGSINRPSSSYHREEISFAGCSVPKRDIVERLPRLLRQFGIPPESFGQQSFKGLEDLAKELMHGESTLELDRDTQWLRRVVQVARVAVFAERGTLKLVEAKQVFADGRIRIRERGNDFAVWEKLKVGEQPEKGLFRAIREELDIRGSLFVRASGSDTFLCEPNDFPLIPSLITTYDFTVLLKREQFSPEGYEERQPDKTTYFRWRAA